MIDGWALVRRVVGALLLVNTSAAGAVDQSDGGTGLAVGPAGWDSSLVRAPVLEVHSGDT